MGTPTHQSDSGVRTFSGASDSYTLTPAANGNGLVVLVALQASRTMTISDSVDGSTGWQLETSNTTPRGAQIWRKQNVSNTAYTITLTNTGGATGIAWMVCESAGVSPTAMSDVSSNKSTSSASTLLECSSAGINTAADVICYCCLRGGSTAGGTAVGSWLKLAAGSNFYYFGVLTSAAALSNEKGGCTASVSQTASGAIASFKADPPSGGGTLYPELERGTRGLNRGITTGAV